MIVFLTGASGFIGRHLAAALAAHGHDVIGAVREPARATSRPRVRYVEADFMTDFDSAAWVPRLTGVEIAINAAGILRERRGQNFYAIHVRGPVALFNACVFAGVRHVIQISALGADAGARSRYHLSKREADEMLMNLPLEWAIVRPSLVYGPGGRSAALFEALASAPLIPLPSRGEQAVQPLHVDDLVAGVLALVGDSARRKVVIPFVGPAPTTLRAMLVELRKGLGLPPARFVSVPLPLVRIAARAGGLLRRGLLDRETLDMLLRGNTGDPRPLAELIKRNAVPVESFVDRERSRAVRNAAKLRWLKPALRFSIALTWLGAGVVSLGLYPVSASLRLLAAAGVTSEPRAVFLLYGAAFLDIGLGVATLLVRRRELWLVQIGVIVLYTSIVSVRLPALWLEPFGPVLKNLPLLAALWLLYELDERESNR